MKWKIIPLWLLSALLSAHPSAFGAGEDPAGPEAVKRAVDQVYRSLVRLTVVTEWPRSGRLEKRTGMGSGTIISDRGDVITSHRVAGHGKRIIGRMWDGGEVELHLVATDPLTDLTLLRMDLAGREGREPQSVARFGDSTRLQVGDVVLAMGCPPSGSQSVTKGTVSNTRHMLPAFLDEEFREDGQLIGSATTLIAHDAVIYPGNNGGPLVNLAGEIVGINQLGFDSFGYAIPGATAQDVAKQLAASGHVPRSWTGIRGQVRPQTGYARQGVLVGGIWPDSPALEAGLKVGDIVTDYDGVRVDAHFEEDLLVFEQLVFSAAIGKQVPVVVLRDGKEQRFVITTRLRGRVLGDDTEFKDWGMVARNLTHLAAIERHGSDTNGVLIVSVSRTSAMLQAQPPVVEGCVIHEVAGQTIRNLEDLRRVTGAELKGAAGTRPMLVRFHQGRRQSVTVVGIGRAGEPSVGARARKPGLSFEFQSLGRELAAALGLKDRRGARVTLVYPGRNAARAGLKEGDILLKLDGVAISCEDAGEAEALTAQMLRTPAGREMALEVLREGQTHTVRLPLDEEYADDEDRELYTDEALELTIGNLSGRDRMRGDLPADLKAAKIVSTVNGGWAEIAGIGGGDVLLAIDGQPTADVADARKLLRQAADRKARRVSLLIRRGIHTFFAWVEPGWSPEGPAADDRK